jgi:DNA-binding HxlR family transcriptional regulator
MAAPVVDTTNPEQFIYQNDMLTLSVLGGIRLEGLDRLRVTLKVELNQSSRPAVRHNLDLYNDNQLEKFIRKVAEKHEIGTSVVAASLSELTEGLEAWRLQQIKAQQGQELKARTLTEAERTAAIEHLSIPNLQQQTLHDLQHTGIQGEAENALILWYAMTSRQCHDPLSVICLARSGTGKSYLMEKVAQCMPAEDLRENTQFTGASFYHFKREEIKGKIFLIEDLDGAQEVMFPIRELQTKKRISKTMTVKDKNGQHRAVTLIVEGPVSVIGCTTREKIYEDNANRAFLLYLDDSSEQDQRIMDYQKRHRAGLIDTLEEQQLREKLQTIQRALRPVRIINPYAPLIDLPKEVFKPRRTLPLLLSFIEAVTFYHQYQRQEQADENTGEVFIETEPQDIEYSFQLLRDVLFRKSDELSGAAREFYQWLSQWQQTGKVKQFYASTIRQHIRIHPRTLNRYLQELTEYGLLQITGGNKHRTGYSYKLIPGSTAQALRDSIDEQISKVMEQIHHAHQQRSPPASPKRKPKQKDTAPPVGQ